MAEPGTYRVSDGAPVPMALAKQGWTIAARPALERVARTYRATIRYSELAEEIQEATGVRTRMLMHYWIGQVLGTVSHECRRQGQPMLSALCVDVEGSVGPGFGGLLAELGIPVPDDLDTHAADERLACYRHFHAAGLPADGGRPALTKQLADKRRRIAQSSAATAPRPICPNCFMSLPLNGVCGNCD
jgi:hypothetical protein